MGHPTARERIDSLPLIERTREWMQLRIEREKTHAGHSARICPCSRGYAATEWCKWCWREMLAVLDGWQ